MMVRAAKVSDALAIAEIWNGMIRDTLFTFNTEEKIAPAVADLIAARAGAFWVAGDEQVFGFVTYGQFRTGPGYGASVEHSIVLSPEARGKRIGHTLMAKALLSAAEQGHHVMVAGISSANPAGVAFHAALGFSHVGRMPEVGRKQGRWLDLILMQKILSSP